MVAKRDERIVSIEEAVSVVKDGDVVGLSGSVLFNQPSALARALIRRGVKDLTLVMLTGGMVSDMLIGAGCVKKVVTTYMAMQDYAPICPNFQRKYMAGEVAFWECDFQHFHCTIKAAQWGMPYLLTKAGIGTDICKINPDLEEIEANGEMWVKVPPTPLDVSLIYASKVDPYGNCIYEGSVFAEFILANATKRAIIVQADEIVPNDVMRSDPRVVILGGPTRADYVVDVPYGAHPDEGPKYYAHDKEICMEYVKAAKSDDTFKAWLDKYVYGPKTQAEYLEVCGGITKLLTLRQSMI
jgi:glutaconate CoA-transferase subunit A